MDDAKTDSCAAERDAGSDVEVFCLMRVGRNSDWLRLFENTESLNGVSVNGNRITADEAHQLKLGDSIQLGVPLNGYEMEFDYILVQRPLKDIKLYLAKVQREGAKGVHISKNPKRKLTVEEIEPSTSNPKLYCCSSADKSFAKPCPLSPVKHQQGLSHIQTEETGFSRGVQEAEWPSDDTSLPSDLDNLQMYSQNILLLREQVDDTQRQVASLEGEPRQADPFGEEQVRELHGQLQMLRAKMDRMATLEKSFSETRRRLAEQKTQQQEEVLKKQLEGALQEQKKVIDELALSRKAFEQILSDKNKELEVTKEEKEKARAQTEEVVTQVTEVLENELQCIICSELFIETSHCGHTYFHCCSSSFSSTYGNPHYSSFFSSSVSYTCLHSCSHFPSSTCTLLCHRDRGDAGTWETLLWEGS